MSRFEDPVVLSCSISGAIANRDQCPAIPYTPAEYAAEARRAVEEGASQIHIHARTPEGVPSYEIEDFRAITEAILAEVDDVIVNYSTGAIGVPIAKRIEYLRELRPDVAALNMSSMNYAKYSARRKDFVFKAVFENSFDTIIEFLTAMRELGIKPEHECFDAGHIANLDPLIDMGLLSEPLNVSLVIGVNGGIRPNAQERRVHVRADPRRRRGSEQLAGDRDLPRPVEAGRRRAGARRQRARRPRGQLLPPRRRDGALERRSDRQGAADGRGRRPPGGHGGRGARAAGRPEAGPRVASGQLPLGDVRVLDLTRLLPGGFCSLLLADLGADVVKVEDTGMGDYVRWAPPFYGSEEQQGLGTRSALYLALNRGKRSIRVDLKSDGGREAFLRLAGEYDVVLESFRPGVLDKLGCGYEALREANPRLVYCAITGYGQTGPNTQRAGHDMNYLGLTGLLGMTGEPQGRPIQSAGQIADLGGGGLMAAVGVLAALRERERSGEGQLVDVSMTDGALAWLAMVAAAYLCDGRVPGRGDGQLNGGFLCYYPYEASDGWVTCGALEPKFWRAFCEGVGREDLIEAQFQPPGSDAWREVADVFRSRTRDEWRAFNDEHDAMIEPVLGLDEALASELVREREMVVELEQPGLGPVRLLGLPIKLSRTPGDATRPAPALGEHTEEVLREAGFDADEVAALLGSGAVAGPSEAVEAGRFMG